MNHHTTLRRALLMACLGHAACAWSHENHDHAAHAASASATPIKRTEVAYEPASVTMQRQDGKAGNFRQMLDEGRKPVVLNFIFTSCTAICPVTTQVFSEVRLQLGKDRDRVNMVSVSIDPENDTPRRLSEYAERFGAQAPSWSFYTGTRADAVAVQKSFNSYQGDKMNHVPVTFVRAAPGKPWVRYDGFASPTMLVQDLKLALNPTLSTQGRNP